MPSVETMNRLSSARGPAAVLLALYLLVLAAAVWLPLPLDPPPMTNAPTYELHLARPDLTAWDFRRNVLMTVPFGVLLPMVVRWRYEAMVLACVVLTLVAETVQLLGSQAVGWDWRAFDVNDLLANTVGGWIGLATTGLAWWVTGRQGRPRGVGLRPHRWIVGIGAAAVVAWVIVETMPSGSVPSVG